MGSRGLIQSMPAITWAKVVVRIVGIGLRPGIKYKLNVLLALMIPISCVTHVANSAVACYLYLPELKFYWFANIRSTGDRNAFLVGMAKYVNSLLIVIFTRVIVVLLLVMVVVLFTNNNPSIINCSIL